MTYEKTRREVDEFLRRLPHIYESFPPPNAIPTEPVRAVRPPTTTTEAKIQAIQQQFDNYKRVRSGYPPQVNSLEDARYWIEILWRYGVQDAERMNDLETRIRKLER